MSQSYPTSVPAYNDTTGGEVLGSAGGGFGLSRILDDYGLDITGIAGKLGTGASTPSADKVLRSTGTGVSVWGAVNITTDVTAFTSAQLLAVVSDETGTGALVFATSPSLTSPRIVAAITDSSGNEVIKTPATSSAVNEVTITNAATGVPPRIEATGDNTDVNLLINGQGTGLVIPKMAIIQGYMVNGKITRTISSNNIIVAIKTLDGNDPSSSNPVHVRIGDTVRTITAALSVTKNAGTNWFNAGSAELATQAIDYFVYLGYNATDGVVLSFSRIPWGRIYSDFSATTTNEKYAAISTIANAAAGDEYELVGRFNAILGVSTSFNWSNAGVPFVNSLPIRETRWLFWTPQFTNLTVGDGTLLAKYKISGDRMIDFHMTFQLGSTSAVSTSPFATLPIASTSSAYSAGASPQFSTIGPAKLLDSAVAVYTGVTRLVSTTEFALIAIGTGGATATDTTITSTVPLTWAVGDAMFGVGNYEAG